MEGLTAKLRLLSNEASAHYLAVRECDDQHSDTITSRIALLERKMQLWFTNAIESCEYEMENSQRQMVAKRVSQSVVLATASTVSPHKSMR
jgi:hypothetical protein